MVLIYDKEIIGYINTFENLAKIKIKDCYKSEDVLIFIVDPIYSTTFIFFLRSPDSLFALLPFLPMALVM